MQKITAGIPCKEIRGQLVTVEYDEKECLLVIYIPVGPVIEPQYGNHEIELKCYYITKMGRNPCARCIKREKMGNSFAKIAFHDQLIVGISTIVEKVTHKYASDGDVFILTMLDIVSILDFGIGFRDADFLVHTKTDRLVKCAKDVTQEAQIKSVTFYTDPFLVIEIAPDISGPVSQWYLYYLSPVTEKVRFVREIQDEYTKNSDDKDGNVIMALLSRTEVTYDDIKTDILNTLSQARTIKGAKLLTCPTFGFSYS